MMRAVAIVKRLAIVMIAAAVVIGCGPRAALCADEGSIVSFTGRIVKVVGDVKILRSGEKEWAEARQGMDVGVRDQIVTGIGSSSDILFHRNGHRSKVRILEEADMSLMTLNWDKASGDNEILLDLIIGHIIIKTDPLKGNSKFEVLTPTSMTAVRGTAFEVEVIRVQGQGPVTNAQIVQ